jgi:hypothetical protein
MDAPAAHERVDAKLAELPEVNVVRSLLRANFWYHYGWEARTTAFARDVPPGGFERLGERLALARAAAEEAWRLRPGDHRSANYFLEIERSVGGDRATMELWFDRAMRANGDDLGACNSKLIWLDPKWHGTVEEMVAFGRACRATGNWRAGITLIVADAHIHAMSLLPMEDRPRYLAADAVWDDIHSVFDEYLGHYPYDNIARSKYAASCFYAARYKDAHDQFQVLGDDLTTWSSFPYTPLQTLHRMRDTAAMYARRAPGTKGPMIRPLAPDNKKAP